MASTKNSKTTSSKSGANIGFEAPFEQALAASPAVREEMHLSLATGELRISDAERIVGAAT